MKRIHIFRYLPEVNAFDVTPEYAELAELVGLVGGIPSCGSGGSSASTTMLASTGSTTGICAKSVRLTRTSWARCERSAHPRPAPLTDGTDGPCNAPDIRLRFWRDVLTSLELTTDLLFAKARDNNNRIQEQALTTPELPEDWIEVWKRNHGWRRDHNDDR